MRPYYLRTQARGVELVEKRVPAFAYALAAAGDDAVAELGAVADRGVVVAQDAHVFTSMARSAPAWMVFFMTFSFSFAHWA